MSIRRSWTLPSLLCCSIALLGCPNDLPGVDDAGVTRRDAGPLDPVDAGADAGPTQPCEPKSCADLEATCGALPDGCGDVLDCGSCSSPNLCGGGGVPNQCGFVRPQCEPLTCDDYENAECGYVADGCGDVVLCDGDCSETFQTCGGGGEPNRCGGPVQSSVECPALLTCDDVGATCGLIGNGCGGVLECGSCNTPYTCGGGGVPSQCGLRDPTPSASCGDDVLDVGEACDDGNQTSGDGCTRDCINIEPGYRCDTPGAACVATVQCGDGLIAGSETCDDGNSDSGDGCSSSCQREDGYSCPIQGAACRATRCGDGIVAGFEECDDGDGQGGDGCSADCLVEVGYRCDAPGQACVTTTCGDGVRQGAEDCDDGNFNTGDGCSPLCTFEPVCSGGDCEERCGDGLKLGSEGCDDGNTRDGDGCSSTCTVEPGFTCSEASEVPVLPVVYRDFIGTESGTKLNLRPGDSGPLHLDFEKYPLQGDSDYRCTFKVEPTLSTDGKPVLQDRVDCVENATTFGQWYRSDDTVNRTIVDELTLTEVAGQSGAYEFFDASFFPINDKGWNAADCLEAGGVCEQRRSEKGGALQNFHFTSETRYWFTYRGGEKLTFDGDDDVWVFIDGKLAVDINGLHPAIQRFIQLPDPNDIDPNAPLNGSRGSKDPIIQGGEVIDHIEDVDTGTAAQWVTDPMSLGLVPGKIYEVAVFHAERHTDKSQYRLTLQNFLSGRSTCEWTCGDGVATRFEVCDDGAANNTGAYGKCNADCLGIGPRCGDGIKQATYEACDDGENTTVYLTSTSPTGACAPNCQLPLALTNCVPLTCTSEGAECGSLADGCGDVVDCGECPAGSFCGGAGVPNQCAEPECEPLTCAGIRAACGLIGDGCGGTVDCGECPIGQVCGATDRPNQCISLCDTKTCAEVGAECGLASDGCDDVIDCGTCDDGDFCVDNRCVFPTGG